MSTGKTILIGAGVAVALVFVARKFLFPQQTPLQQITTGVTDILGAVKGSGTTRPIVGTGSKPGTSPITGATGGSTGIWDTWSSPAGPLGDSPYSSFSSVATVPTVGGGNTQSTRFSPQPTQFTSFAERATAGAMTTSPYRLTAATARS
jgi:hypothetical protein